MPVYNVELYLEDCLNSILSQTFADYEMICVNDASTDHSYDILLRYAEKYEQIKIVNNSRNAGPSFSRNRGMDLARGEYILFVDSDDMLRSDALKILNDTVEKNDAEVVCYRYSVKNEGRKPEEQNTLTYEQIMFDGSIKTGRQWFIEMAQKKLFLVSPCITLFKREFVIKHNLRFYEGILYEDILYTLSFSLAASKVIYIHEFLYIHRRRDSSITTTLTEFHLDSYVIVLGEILKLWRVCKREEEMDKAIRQYVNKLMPVMNKMISLFPEHSLMKIGTSADQFLLDILRGAAKEFFYYVHLTDQEIQQIQQYNKIIIFGAGAVAAELVACLQNRRIDIEAVAVSDKSLNRNEIAGIRIYQIDELADMYRTALIIIGVLKHNQPAIYQKLVELGCENIMCIDTDGD